MAQSAVFAEGKKHEAKSAVSVAPFSVARRQIAPQRACAQYPKHSVYKSSRILGVSAVHARIADSVRFYQRSKLV